MIAQKSLSELHEQFCAEAEVLRCLTPKTIKWYQYGFKSLMSFERTNNPATLTEDFLSGFLIWGRKERGWNERTMTVNYNALSSFFNWLVKKGVLEISPLANLPRPKLPALQPKTLSQQEAETIFHTVQILPAASHEKPALFYKYRNIAIFAVFLYAGLRRQELFDLKCTDIDLEAGMLNVALGKGKKQRTVPICYSLGSHLKAYMQEREKLAITSSWLFVTPAYQKQMSDSTLKRLFAKVKELSGIHFSPHILRHTFATLMCASNCNIYSLSKMMGHSDIRTTTGYLGVNQSQMIDQANRHPLNFL